MISHEEHSDTKKAEHVENAIARQIVDSAWKVHNSMGPGLLESVYEVALAHELRKRGLNVERQVPIPVVYDNIHFDEGFRADLLVERKVLVELKSVDEIHPVHFKQTLTQLKMADLKLGLLINFGDAYFKSAKERIINGTLS
jgi:GxxExxY protein